ncbi:SirB2 family protein [Inhella crocodyli]|uniref:Invasion protein n=1 Tax=Inhella crocodyli TaxID=2499851 RepID=A0A3S2WV36_9BURK|nr:SirB2 family protein [Inhella crocodyli]RVT88699.1 hypothetical protein EOD73_06955 [Inhella crocodyli]
MDLYPVLKHTHMGLAAVSVLGFALRGLAVLAGARWPMKAGVRQASVVVDSLLLAAGLGLWAWLKWAPMGWLHVKLGLLLAYIVLGAFALKRARSASGKALCFLLALLCVLQMAAVARFHHPLGLLKLWV